MKRKPIRTLAGAVAALLVLGAGPAWAGHRPNSEGLMGGAISWTGQYAEPAGRQVNSIKLWVDEVSNKAFLHGRPPERKAVIDVAQNMAMAARRMSRTSPATARTFMAGRGVEINDVSPAELAKMGAAVTPVYDWAQQQCGEAYGAKVLKAVGR